MKSSSVCIGSFLFVIEMEQITLRNLLEKRIPSLFRVALPRITEKTGRQILMSFVCIPGQEWCQVGDKSKGTLRDAY